MTVKTPSKTEFNKWLPARMVSDRLYKYGSSIQLTALGDRLKVGLVTAAAGHMSVAQTEAIGGPCLIPARHWKPLEGLAHNDVWQTGQLTLYFQQDYRSAKIRHDYYGVRFEPNAINAMLEGMEWPKLNPEIRENLAVSPSAPQEVIVKDETTWTDPEDSGNGEPVTLEELRAWHDLYSKLYQGDFPLSHAVRSAKGFFPDKRVGRDRVHSLFPTRKSGRKPVR